MYLASGDNNLVLAGIASFRRANLHPDIHLFGSCHPFGVHPFRAVLQGFNPLVMHSCAWSHSDSQDVLAYVQTCEVKQRSDPTIPSKFDVYTRHLTA